MLVAAAGYGKTTLAEQWVRLEGRKHAWYTARTASADVAALALGIARACSAVIADSEVRLREHLRAMSAAAEHTSALAEILSEDLAAWPKDAWLVIDDYQEFAGALEAEGFVADLVASCPVQLLITSRQRPTWVSGRSVVYGEILEIDQDALAMDNDEAAQVLAGWSLPSASALVELAHGWPAVIGLASASPSEIRSDDTVPESLYQFFAEEVFDALGDEVRAGLALLAVAPVLDDELAHELLGERAEAICGMALEVGILVERDDRLELHPLARAFLEERGATSPDPTITSICLQHYQLHREWDAAFDLILRRDLPDELEELLAVALDDLLKAVRLSTIEAWCDAATHSGTHAPIVALARAEISLRDGRQARAKAYGELAASSSALAFRAYSLAGRAAHLESYEEEALEFYRHAEASAESEAERREARWNQVMCVLDIDPTAAYDALQDLRVGVSPTAPREFVVAATCILSLGARSGKVDDTWAEVAWELIPTVGDPLVQTSFESIYSNVLALSAQYEDALRVATELLDTARHYRLDFARPHGLIAAATAHAGMRGWSAATTCLDEATRLAHAAGDIFAEQLAYAVRLRALTQQGKHLSALALPVPDLSHTVPALRGEVLGSRALALAVSERSDEAKSVLAGLQAEGAGVESAVLSVGASAIVSLRCGKAKALDEVTRFAEEAFGRGAPDLLVTGYRAAPEILEILLRDPNWESRLRRLVQLARDDDILRPLGLPRSSEDSLERLSPSEREVYQLVCRGFSNREIAELLVISPATAKLHVQRIFDKLGIHSRKTLAVQAALQRMDLGDVGHN